jgi:hypothetical protein
MRPLILKCPSCNGDLTAARLVCPACAISIEGEFGFPALLRLNRAQLDFVEVFLKNRGIIREVERELGVSYPTVRARLDEVIEALGFNPEGAPAPTPDDHGERAPADNNDDRGEESLMRSRRALLEQLRAGKITPAQALRSLSAGTPANLKAQASKPEREEPDDG